MIDLPDRHEVAKALGEIEFFELAPGRMVCNLEDVARALGIWSGFVSSDEVTCLIGLVEGGTCRNLAMRPCDEFLCSSCGEHLDIAYMDSVDDYHARYCPHCGRTVVAHMGNVKVKGAANGGKDGD